ncbi:MAG: toll/interleukin-1 receptor domain-containing protein [Armatimonadetes bacterium]|nr:toll/interleukin-1 receptor domain-containing protein [Armatimonadota bacterium]
MSSINLPHTQNRPTRDIHQPRNYYILILNARAETKKRNICFARQTLAADYEIAITGKPTVQQVSDLKATVVEMLAAADLTLGTDVLWRENPAAFTPSNLRASAVVYFGAPSPSDAQVTAALGQSVPILPVVSTYPAASQELPSSLAPLNALALDSVGIERIAATLLDLLGLVHSKRKIFISYRRLESTEAALQLFAKFSSRNFQVFLDTHGVPPAVDFQQTLWHELSDSDVILMLDTPDYFGSRWTTAEFQRALASDISIVRIGWPDVSPSPLTTTLPNIALTASNFLPGRPELDDASLDRIVQEVEMARSKGYAVRVLNMHSLIRDSVENLGGQVLGVGQSHAVLIKLADGRQAVLVPCIGAPTSVNLNSAEGLGSAPDIGVIYDSVGLLPDWLTHLDWLGKFVNTVRWIKRSEIEAKLGAW